MQHLKDNLSVITYTRNIQLLQSIMNNPLYKELHNRILYLIIPEDWEEGALCVIEHPMFDINSFMLSGYYYDSVSHLTKYVDMLAYANGQNQT